MRILLIEDDIELAKVLVESLEMHNIIVDTCNDGESGSYVARTNSYDLILMDNILPKKLGINICKELRNLDNATPILFMSIQSDVSDKIKFLEAGADDCISKPFSIHELVARIRAIGRRSYDIKQDIITLDDVTIDRDNYLVCKRGKPVYFTRKEFMILEQIAQKPGRVITRSEIMEHVWKKDFNPFSNTIETHIRNIRKKIDGKYKKKIETIPGRGYRIRKQEN
ncbi:response regulator transcription factor [Candidatus Parcubacteria bacterium]|nr:response regulator transcription factor [Candidatus Parcubacteria bacterium]